MALSSGLAAPTSQAPPLPAVSNDLGAPAAPQPSANQQPASADPLAGVMSRIYHGESGGNPYALYGGGNFGFPSWPGRMGPAGISHAAGLGQDEPSTWNSAVKGWIAANPGQPAPNFQNPADQDKVNRFLARQTYGVDSSGRNLDQAAAAGAVDYSRLAKTWPSLGRGAQSFPDSTFAERVRSDRYGEAANLDKTAQAAIAQIGKMGGDVTEAMKRVRAALDKSDQAQDATLEAIKKAPQQPEVNALQHIGGLATVVGILGGLFTKAPMRASLNGMAAAIEAYNSGDQRAYQQSYNDWKTHTDLLMGISKMQADRVREIMAQEDLGLNERNALLDTTLRALGLTDLANQRRTQGDEALLQWQEMQQKAQQSYQQHLDTVENTNAYKFALLAQRQAGKWNVVTGADPQGRSIQYRYNADTAESTDLSGNPLGFVPVGAAKIGAGGGGGLNQYGDPPEGTSPDPNKPTEGSSIPKSVWDGATQLALTGRMPTLGSSTQGRAAIQSALPWVLAARGMTPADMVQQSVAYQGALTGEKTLAARLANLNVGLSEVPHLGDQLVQVSEATPRTEYMNVNQLLQAAELRTGDPQIVRLGAAINSYLQAYSRAINPTGIITDDIRAHADFVLNQAMAKGQISAGVDQLNVELKAMQAGLKDAAAAGKTMFVLPGEPQPKEAGPAPKAGDVPVPSAKYSAKWHDQIIYSDDGKAWYDKSGLPIESK